MKRTTDKLKIWLFGGTTEGKVLAERLAGRNLLLDVSVATEYGKEVLPEAGNVRVRPKRMDAGEMAERMKQEAYDLVLDATHPFAREVSENIQIACGQEKIPLIRVLRDSEGNGNPSRIWVETVEEAVEFLKGTNGNILVTTGSKELGKFTELPDFSKRVYARVLSLPQVVQDCAELGFYGENLIAMQGPFSKEMNLAILHSINASWLVTKESGRNGGYEEKEEAARLSGAGLVVIGRPKEEGLPLKDVFSHLEREYGVSLKPVKRRISLIGAGPGDLSLLTAEAREELSKARLIAGSDRLIQTMEIFGKPVLREYRPVGILEFLKNHPEYDQAAVVLSGDTGFYSGAKKLAEAFQSVFDMESDVELKILPGISSMTYFFSRLGISWEDVKLISLHGRKSGLLRAVRENRRVFALAGGRGVLTEICKRLMDSGYSEVVLTVGENLSLPGERIYSGTPGELLGQENDPLFVVYIENPAAGKQILGHGLPDSAFIRGQVPMTKMEVRTVSVSKLQLKPGSVVYDVGAGTGSVSVECAGLSGDICVYAIEKNSEALNLLRDNQKKFGLENIEIVEGEAPESMKKLPAPTHVFIGGSGGKMKEIVSLALEKNPGARFVANLITMESMSTLMEILETMPVCNEEIVQLSAARDKKAGKSHLMMGQNPVWIASFDGKGEDGEIR